MRIVVINHVTVDGVMQGPGRPDEDTRDGFAFGGWAGQFVEEVQQEVWGRHLGSGGDLLFGRRTYEDVLGFWNTTDSPFRDALNAARKYVVSRTLADPPPWSNTVIVRDDPVTAVRELQQSSGPDVHIMGSGLLVAALAGAGLIDEYVLTVNPLVFGTGRRMFDEGFPPGRLSLVEARPTATGVVILTYRPDGPLGGRT